MFKFEIDSKTIDKEITQFVTRDIPIIITNIMEKLAITMVQEIQKIIQERALDTGEFVQSIDYKMYKRKDNIGFRIFDGVPYGKYWEFGTISHWVPFYNKNGDPILADWAHRHGFSEEDMEKLGGLMVQIPKLQPFKNALIYGAMKLRSIAKSETKKYD